ncbi:hypothetical protein [Sinorhizobium meliloti]|uniref:Uncharacterized protein n=1 Tax=Rhizobium meliloti TaxID=382 RepID=A0A2J0Z8H6_RHIML|nr:hypothetical protein [Sinorhizobium meliloti]PJR16809.1 hypothetical protein CEJ86_00970 [Sinorhizobium meliloti]
MSARRLELSEASNGGWIVTETLGVDAEGRMLVSTRAAFTDTADVLAGLEQILRPSSGSTLSMQEGDV